MSRTGACVSFPPASDSKENHVVFGTRVKWRLKGLEELHNGRGQPRKGAGLYTAGLRGLFASLVIVGNIIPA